MRYRFIFEKLSLTKKSWYTPEQPKNPQGILVIHKLIHKRIKGHVPNQ